MHAASKLSDKRVGVALFATMFSTCIGQSFLFAIMPIVGRQIGVADIGVGLIASLPTFTYVVAAPILGGLVDKVGAVLLIRIGLAAGIVSNIVFALAVMLGVDGQIGPQFAFFIFLTSRVLLSIGYAGMFPAAQVLVASNTPASQRRGGMAFLAGASGLGYVAGPIVPSLLSSWAPTTPFYVVSMLIGFSLLTTLLIDTSTPRSGNRGPTINVRSFLVERLALTS
jgi:MFS family permease